MYRGLLLEDLVALSARIPVLLSLLLAGGSYYFIQFWILGKWTSIYASKANIEEIIIFNLLYLGGHLFKFLLPLVFTLGALFRLYLIIRYRLFAPKPVREKIKKMSFKDFMLKVSAQLTRQGYHVELTHEDKTAPFNCILYKGEHKVLLKCFHKKMFSTVKQKDIQALYNQLNKMNAHSCMAVTSGIFNREVIKFSLGKPIVLVDIDILKDWI